MPSLPPPIKTNVRDNSSSKQNIQESYNDLYSMVNNHINQPMSNPNPMQNQPMSNPNPMPNPTQPTDQQNQVLQQLMNQQKMFQEEIIRLREMVNQPQVANLNSNPNPNPNLTNPTIAELEQYKQINTKLQDRIIELQSQIQNQIQNPKSTIDAADEQKISQLNKVKEQTMEQIQKLKSVQEDINKKTETTKNLEAQVKKLIGENIEKFENAEEVLYINSQTFVLENPIRTITSIELRDLDLPFDKYNINSNNNKLQFIKEAQTQHPNADHHTPSTDSDTANAIDSDMEIQFNVETNQNESNQNEITLSLTMGNYNIEHLTEIINKALKQFNIKMSVSKSTNIISFKSSENFNLVFGPNTMLNNLGFNLTTQSKYSNSNKYTGSKAYDFKPDRCMNIYMSNINDSKPVMQYISPNTNRQSKKIVFAPVISELDKIVLKFTDSKGKEFKFDPDSGLDFSIQVIVRHINPNHNHMTNMSVDASDVSSDDVFNIVKQSIKSN